MRRFIAEIENGKVVLDDERRHHAKVIRFEIGEKIEVVTRGGEVFEAVVDSIEPLSFSSVKKLTDFTRELPYKLVLFAPLLKGSKFDFIIQKATELGVTSIVPYISSRTIVRLNKDEFNKKKVRYQKIIEEAVEQSNRDFIPTLTDLYTFKALASISFDKAFIAYEEESLKSTLIPNDYHPKKNDIVVVLIGPEGGFSEEEVEYIKRSHYECISLGKRILKAETAVVYLLSVLAYKGEQI